MAWRGISSVRFSKRRYQEAMVASHTARRTCITNMYLARKSDGTSKYTIGEMMHVSGHKSIKL